MTYSGVVLGDRDRSLLAGGLLLTPARQGIHSGANFGFTIVDCNGEKYEIDTVFGESAIAEWTKA